MAEENKHKATFWVVFDAEVYGPPHWDNKRVRKIRPKKMLQSNTKHTTTLLRPKE